ncbi:MAG: hypothetical protein KME10_25270 [Plectolyngbya sp. WJT66-NPBG17]|jgi:hypothetical protein|nr:hypothetical protein [Plectolyngbya sp. WJT66-NPBG17]MBW4528963.1 hypothetical protein [Phormidium tanganyikae FI6-MK23]
MKLYHALLPLTVALGLSSSACQSIPASAQLFKSIRFIKVAQASDQSIQTLPDVEGIRFRAVTYQRSETQSGSGLDAAIRREFPTGTVRFLYNPIDLNGDGRSEFVVYITSDCGSGGCPMLVLQPTGSGFKTVSRHTIVNNPVVISNTKTNAWRDIVLYVAGGGAKPSYHILKFDGSTYPSNPSMTPEVAPGTIVSGTAIIADQISPNVGIVLGNNSSNQRGGLNSSQQASLKSLGIAIAVPTSIPAGYTVSKVDVKPCPANTPRSDRGVCRFGPQYGIVYRNAQQDRCFAIEATGGGVGGVPAEYEVQVKTELLGETALLFGQQNGEFKTPSAQQLNSPQPNLLTDWAGVGPFYRISGADFVRQSYDKGASSQCRNTITPNQALQIVRSLTWLK